MQVGLTLLQDSPDFLIFGELGRRGFGYDVKLMNFFADLLNDNAITNVAIAGIGNAGDYFSTIASMNAIR